MSALRLAVLLSTAAGLVVVALRFIV